MASILDRLGRFAAGNPWPVIAGWLIALGLAVGAFFGFGGALATSFSIPGTETARVNDQLAADFEGLDGASATVVFRTDDDSALTTSQQEQITALLEDLTEVDGVVATVDPFATAAQLAATEQQLSEGTAQLEAGRAQLESGQAQLDAAQLQLDSGQAQLDAAIAQAQAAGLYEQAAAQLDAQQTQLDAGQTEIDAQQAQLDAGLAELEAQEEQLTLGSSLADYASEIRTVSEDGSTALGMVSFDDDLFSMPTEVKDAVAGALDDAAIPGITIDYSSEIATSVDGLLGPGEIIGVIVAALVLLLMLRSLLPAMLPLLSSLVGVGVGVVGSLAFSGIVDMSAVTPVLGVMLGLAVGIDYSLFIINRHRRQLLEGLDVHTSIGRANGTSGNAVVFAGATVFVALLALTLTGIPFLGVMGVVGAACVLIAVLVAISFTPAVLGLLGTKVLSRRARARIGHEDHLTPVVRSQKTHWALVTVAAAVAGLLVVAIPALSMRLGLPDGSSEAPDTTQYRAFESIADDFGEGMNGPLLVLADVPEAIAEEDVLATQAELAALLMEREDVVAVAPVAVSGDREAFAFQIVPAEGPTSLSTELLVHELRDLSPLADGTELGVAGQASGNIDISQILADALPIYLIVVIGLSLLIMMVVFRSILVPLVATAGFVLSLFAALGAMVAVYQWGWLGDVFGVHTPGPLLNFAPIIITGVLFGLAMDYQLFIVSGMREGYVHGLSARQAVVSGVRNARAVVTAAAIIMVSVFGGFVFSHLAMVRPLGFGLAIGVLFDAFVVRMLLIPALMHLLGEKAWWLPKWLDRIVPDVDVEGASLERKAAVR